MNSKKIILKQIQSGTLNIKEVRNHLITVMTEEELLADTKKKIVAHALKYFNFRNYDISQNKNVKKYSDKVLSSFNFYGLTKWHSNKPIDGFFHTCLGLHCKPIKYKLTLENKVLADLNKINAIVEKYKENEFIKSYIESPQTPRNHEQKVKLIFYLRAENKRKELLDYLENHLNLRAINKSIQAKVNASIKFDMDMELSKDYPYYELLFDANNIYYGIDFEKLDSSKINLLHNKWQWLGYVVGYNYDKATYTHIISKVNGNEVVSGLLSKVKSNHLLNSRMTIFNELKHLFLHRKYYGFYALSIPQIEGIFTDMIALVKPKSASLNKSLTEKVNFIMEYFPDSNFNFDYYMYYLPVQRNKFSHTGKDDLIKGKAYQVLLDLSHIIDMYNELDSPLIQINNIMNKGENGFNHIGDYAKFLILVDDNNVKNNSAIVKEYSKFAKILFKNGSKINIIIDYVFLDFERCYDKFCNNLNIFSLKNTNVDLKNQSNEQLTNNIILYKNVLEHKSSLIFGEDFKVLISVVSFIKLYNMYFQNINDEIKNKINSFRINKKDQIQKIQIINSKIKIDIPDSFFLNKNELQHITNSN